MAERYMTTGRLPTPTGGRKAESRDGRRGGGGGAALAGDDVAPWVLVAGGFHARGAMDKANAALAAHLLERGRTLHLVAHAVDARLAAHPRVETYVVPRPAGSDLLGELLLARRGREVAATVTAREGRARVVTNGGNCDWPDINWVHCVHDAWVPSDAGAPLWFRAKNRLTRALARRRERAAILSARFVVANSDRTRRDLVERLGVDASRVHTVYLGGGPTRRGPVTCEEERRAARAAFGLRDGRPVVAFVGALGHDRNKGLDTLWRAWRRLSARDDWDASLLVAGGGRGLEAWRARVRAEWFEGSVRLPGFVEDVERVYAAADLLVSPARYEAYGLGAHEAICLGVPALVSGRAGVAELYPAELSEMLLPDPEDSDDLAARLLDWRGRAGEWRERFKGFASGLAGRTWSDVAEEFLRAVEGGPTRGAFDGGPSEASSSSDEETTAVSAGRVLSAGVS